MAFGGGGYVFGGVSWLVRWGLDGCEWKSLGMVWNYESMFGSLDLQHMVGKLAMSSQQVRDMYIFTQTNECGY